MIDLPLSALLGVTFAAGALAALGARMAYRTWFADQHDQRVDGIISAARRYALGDLSRPAPDYGDDDLGRVARSMEQAVRELALRIDGLARDRARMEAILASMIEGVLVVDAQGRLQLVNAAARRILRLEQSSLDHHYVEAIRHPDIVEHIGRALKGEPTEGLELSVTRDRRQSLVARVAPVDNAGRGVVLVMHDITDLRQADQVRRDFVANVSHELRTPLTAIRGYAEALLDDPDDAEARHRFLDVIHRHASRMERLVNDLLRLARLDAGQETVDLAPCDIESLIHGIVSDLDTITRDKSHTIVIDVPADASTLQTDTAKLHDVLRNLVENALNYTPAGGTITVRTARAGGRFRLSVSDTGPGIPPADLGRVFERFYRVDQSRARPGGTGLGLSIVKHLAHVLGGEVEVTNEAGGGACFTASFPAPE